MSEKKQSQKPVSSNSNPNSNNVVAIVVDRCKAEGCKAKSVRAGFCEEHFMWFKEGLITTEGHHAKDFEKKYQQFMKSKKKVA